MIDLSTIQRALSLMLVPGQVTELRALGVKINGGRRVTVSGYFDDHAKLALEASQISATGIYITPNPVNVALLARAENRVRVVNDREPLTSDSDVTGRRWLLVDADPKRPAGISASDAEHAAALQRVEQIRDTLTEVGWPEPLMADSGNGGHLLYWIDLPVDDGGLVKRVLGALAFRFSDSTVEIDQKVFNPARIWKLYGTVARKGDDTAERPHRLARILSAPAAFEVVSVELLRAVADSIPRDDNGPRHGRHGDQGRGSFDLERWIADHGLEVDGPQPWQGGRKWIFDVCPWNREHRNRSAYIVELASGTIAAGCQHNSCSDRRWHDLRDVFRAGLADREEELASSGR